jgi:hypothetical protein
VDTFNDKDDDFQSMEELARFCAQQYITEDMLAGAPGFGDLLLHPSTASLCAGGIAAPTVPAKPPTSASRPGKGKEKLMNAVHNMSPNPRPQIPVPSIRPCVGGRLRLKAKWLK